MNNIRIGVLGSVDVGKSTLIGVLKHNKLDDGRGLTRKFIMKHKHEITSGRTSCISYHNVNIENNLITFVDLAGHETYLKTTMYGLSGLNLDYILLIVGANMGISKMTKEHFNLVKLLQIPLIFVINKIDLCPENILNETFNNLQKIAHTKLGGKKNLYIVENTDLINNKDFYKTLLIYNNKISINNNLNNIQLEEIIKNKLQKKQINLEEEYPLFFTSNKTGYGIDNLKNYLNLLENNNNNNNLNKTSIFIIQETYNIHGVGIVFYGYVKSGIIKKNDKLIIGPFNSRFYNIYIRNVRNVLDQDTNILEQNESGCIAIKQLSKEFIFKRDHIRKGMYITNNPNCCNEFIARVHILHHPTTIKTNYQSTIHCGTVIQAAQITEILNIKNNKEDNKILRTGDYAKVKFKFLFRPEYIEENSMFIFRENNTKGVGKVLSINNINI